MSKVTLTPKAARKTPSIGQQEQFAYNDGGKKDEYASVEIVVEQVPDDDSIQAPNTMIDSLESRAKALWDDSLRKLALCEPTKSLISADPVPCSSELKEIVHWVNRAIRCKLPYQGPCIRRILIQD